MFKKILNISKYINCFLLSLILFLIFANIMIGLFSLSNIGSSIFCLFVGSLYGHFCLGSIYKKLLKI